MASLNRWVAHAMLVLSAVLLIIGAFFGFFGGINDGVTVGVKLFLVPGFIALALYIGSFGFRRAERAHAAQAADRWMAQFLAIAIAYVAFLGALYAMSLLDRFFPPN